jgi:hypothetical protein
MRQGTKVAIGALLVAVVAGIAFRQPMGRSRPDLAAILSFDDGPLTFARTYSSGVVGPFAIGDSREVTARRLSALPLLAQDRPQLSGKAAVWRVALPAKSGGHAIYTLRFERERVATVKAFYSMFAGL